jgi:hypothetical protein
MEKKLKFEFLFSLENEGCENCCGCGCGDDDTDEGIEQITYGFDLTPPDGITTEDFWECSTQQVEDLQDILDEVRSDLEDEYGVHDFGGGEEGDSYIWGFNTYEVPSGKIMELVTKWRDAFVKLNFKVGDIKLIDDVEE